MHYSSKYQLQWNYFKICVHLALKIIRPTVIRVMVQFLQRLLVILDKTRTNKVIAVNILNPVYHSVNNALSVFLFACCYHVLLIA